MDYAVLPKEAADLSLNLPKPRPRMAWVIARSKAKEN
jgi:hypothetical protein